MVTFHAFFRALAELVSNCIRWYDATLFALLVKSFQPLGLLIAIAALIYTINGFREDRVLREATLITMFVEQEEIIRKMESSGRGSIPTHLIARDIIERMVNVGMELSWIDTSDLKLNEASFQGGDFAGAQLRGVSLVKTDLSSANFMRSDLNKAKLHAAILRKVDFTEADLRNANFWKADLTDATLTDANIGGAKLKHAVGLTQSQLDLACITSVTGESPPEVPDELRWTKRECKRIIIP